MLRERQRSCKLQRINNAPRTGGTANIEHRIVNGIVRMLGPEQRIVMTVGVLIVVMLHMLIVVPMMMELLQMRIVLLLLLVEVMRLAVMMTTQLQFRRRIVGVQILFVLEHQTAVAATAKFAVAVHRTVHLGDVVLMMLLLLLMV